MAFHPHPLDGSLDNEAWDARPEDLADHLVYDHQIATLELVGWDLAHVALPAMKSLHRVRHDKED